MNFLPHRMLPIAAAAALLALYGCGGNGDDDDDNAPPVNPPATASLSGVVLASAPVSGARVCLDVNDNRACDTTEPTATSAADGKYTLTGNDTDVSSKAVLAVVPAAGTARTYMLGAPAGKGALVTPYTTLVLSAVDAGRAPNLAQAEIDLLDKMVGTAGDVGGLNAYSDYRPNAADTAFTNQRARMLNGAQILTRAFQDTMAISGLTGKDAFGALGLVATGSMQQVLGQVGTAELTGTNFDTLYAAVKDSLVPTQATIDAVKTAKAKTAAAPIEGAWVKTTGSGTSEMRELFIFAGDGTFVHQVIKTGQPTTNTAFDAGFGYRYGRYTLNGSVLAISLIEAANASGPTAGNHTATISGNAMTFDGSSLTRVTGTDSAVGGYVRTNGMERPEYLVLFADGTYTHGTFYYENDPQTGTASFFETARSAGIRQGRWARGNPSNTGTPGDPPNLNPNVIDFALLTPTDVTFNGSLAIPGNPGVASIQADGSLSATDLRMVKLGTTAGAQAVTGFSEATRSRLWSGRYFSRTVSVAGTNRTQYVYVRGVNDVLTFLQAPTGSVVTNACPTAGAVVDFATVAPTDGKLKQFVVGTSTAASAGYAQRRLNVGTPGTGNFVTYTPITRPTDATARCAVPL
ncbi:hypothetical protein [Piscinibacter koreensis]|uniref:Uncharacterized protein n=1 Tax=Piscinibacter koreensis TaxID=2742824 RepID=A0A7Y6NJQ9_9BURK|nr:hypothetical protein [Schlegelella koreensis]NUZ04422.1 hypothetical protein [Schlegelella koreensis]